MRAIGIDIGTSSIKVVEAQSTSKGVQLLSYTEHLLSQNPAHDTELEILEFLQNLAHKYEATQTKVAIALRQERVSVRHKTFPFADRLKILKSLPFELEEDLPFSAETAVYDARVVGISGTQADVLACAAPKHRVSELLGKYQNTGLAINILSAEGLAFANCFERWWDPIPQLPPRPLDLESEAAPTRNLNLVIQMGHTHTILNAFENGRLVAVRSILWGGKTVAEAISRKYEIPYVEALSEMRGKAFILPNKDGASYDQIVFSDTIATQFREFGRELKLSILEIETELGGKVITAEVTGGLANVLNVSALLTQLIEIPVNPASVLAPYLTNFEKTPAIEHSIGTALGLALEALRKPRNPALQFLRGEFAPRNESFEIFWETWGLTVKVAAACLVLFFAYSLTRESLSESLAQTADDVLREQAKVIAKLPAKQANEAGVKKYIREKRRRAQEMKSLEGLARMNSALEILRKISDASPSRSGISLNVNFVRIEDQAIFIEGTVGSAQERAALQKALTPLAKDGRINAREGTPVSGDTGIPFAFGFVVDRGTQQ
jgi:general secretion pathway protein L